MIWGNKERKINWQLRDMTQQLSILQSRLDLAHNRIDRLLEALELVEIHKEAKPALPKKTIIKKRVDLTQEEISKIDAVTRFQASFAPGIEPSLQDHGLQAYNFWKKYL